jgi:hypothetical protein
MKKFRNYKAPDEPKDPDDDDAHQPMPIDDDED